SQHGVLIPPGSTGRSLPSQTVEALVNEIRAEGVETVRGAAAEAELARAGGGTAGFRPEPGVGEAKVFFPTGDAGALERFHERTRMLQWELMGKDNAAYRTLNAEQREIFATWFAKQLDEQFGAKWAYRSENGQRVWAQIARGFFNPHAAAQNEAY